MDLKKRPRPRLVHCALFLNVFLSLNVWASDYRAGAALGFGGTGISSTTFVKNTPTQADRSEGPGVLTVFVDRLITDRFTLGLEHSRGFSLGPFSNGEWFTGLTTRWYFMGPVPSVAVPSPDGATFLIRGYNLYTGLTAGVAQASISRNSDQIPNVSGSGVFFGVKFGADYALAPGIGLLPELIYSTTLMNSDPYPAKLTEFAIQCGLYFYL